MNDKLTKNCQNINKFLADEEAIIRSRSKSQTVYVQRTYKGLVYQISAPEHANLVETPLAPNSVIRAGSGRRRRVNPDGTPYVRPEFPEGGDPRFRAVLAEMLKTHISKSNDYGTGDDIYANYRASETIGVPAWKSCFIRALEKVQRLTNAFGGKKLNHESVSDSFIDLANHIVISKVLYDEAENAKTACCGGDCQIC